jgi:hypothetical protein
LFKMVQENLLRTLKFYARMLESQTKQKWFFFFLDLKKKQYYSLIPEYNLSWNIKVITVLGVRFTTDLSEIIDLNLDL